jgi:hypothetical protein
VTRPDPDSFTSGEADVTRPDPDSFTSGDRGDVTHPWRRAKRTAGELAFSAIDAVTATRLRAARLARTTRSPLDVLVLTVYRDGSLIADSLPALHSTRHNVRLALGAMGAPADALREETVAEGLAGGKFENLNRVLEAAADRSRAAAERPGAAAERPGAATGRPGAAGAEPASPDWILVVDDDVRLPRAFLDRFLAVCEAFELDLAQPAQTLRSHSAWKVTRRRPASMVRITRFVEIGPVTAFGRRAAAELLPFPELRFGWGLDLHWAALAGRHGWRLGIVDALPVRHDAALVGTTYSRDDAVEEAASFLTDRPYLPSARAGEVLATHRRARG